MGVSLWSRGYLSGLDVLDVTLEQLRQFLLPILTDLDQSTVIESWLTKHFTKRFASYLRNRSHNLAYHLVDRIWFQVKRQAKGVVTPWDLSRALQQMNAFRYPPRGSSLPVTFVIGTRRLSCHKNLDFVAGALLCLRQDSKSTVQILMHGLPLNSELIPPRYLRQPTRDFEEGFLSLCSWIEYFS